MDLLTAANIGRRSSGEEEDDDPELEKALLSMFVDQGDVSPDVLLEKKSGNGGRGQGRTVIELDQPLDLQSSRELLSAMDKYEAMEQRVWDEVSHSLTAAVG